MRFLIIGLGIYGSNLAIDLTNMGHEVIGADINETLVDAIKDYISTAYIIDSTDTASLRMLPINDVDIVIVAIGENFGASVRTVALLKSLDVKHIYARAIDKLHESILEGFHLDRIITPEQRAAEDLVHEMELGANVATLRVDATTYVLRFRVPKYFIGLKYSDLNLVKDFKVTLLAATRGQVGTNVLGLTVERQHQLDLGVDTTLKVEEDDTFTCLATATAYRDMCRRIN